MSFPRPEPGLVVRYAYLWLREHRQGHEEGSKDRPCAIVMAAQDQDGAKRVLVVPITHTPPDDPTAAMELPQQVKKHLGLDAERSWVVLSESNVFAWPGPDLRRIEHQGDRSIAYGFLPPSLFNELKRRFILLGNQQRSARVPRTE